jgi:long-chain fatty acid transport protein
MKKRKSLYLKYLFLLSLSLSCLLMFVVDKASATNGYFSNAYSLESQGLAGAGVALSQGALDASINPATMAFIGSRLDAGITFFNPNRKYTAEGTPSGPPAFGLTPGTEHSNASLFLIPSFGVNWAIDDKSSFGVSIGGNGGMNTYYKTNTFFGSSPTGVDLLQVFIAPTYARKITDHQAFGVTPIFAYQRFAARGLQAFSAFSSDPDHLTNKGYDNSLGVGGKIGYFVELFPFLNIGASYQSRIIMSRFDKYQGLFAERGSFDIPSTWVVGLAVKPVQNLALLADVQQINYSDIKAIHNPFMPNIQKSKLGRDNGAGFGWDDILILKLGVQWKSSKDWTWRAGYSIGDQPIPSSEVLFNIIAPGVIKEHATFGFTRAIGDNNELKFALVRAFPHSVSGPNPLDPAQRINITMNQWEVSLGYTWKF